MDRPTPPRRRDHSPAPPDAAGLCALNTALLRRAGARLGWAGDLSPDAVAGFERYAAELVVWNRRFNLTRITRPDHIAIQHFLDSLVCLRGVPAIWGPSVRCIDVGTGAGLPGIPLKLVRPGWRLTLVDSVGKKVAFLRHVVEVLDLTDVEVLHARAEDVARDPARGGSYDLAVARAVAALPVLAAYALPLLRPGGRMVALKGAAIADELAAVAPVLESLGGRLIEAQPYRLPGIDHVRHLAIVERVRAWPDAAPRGSGAARRGL